MAPDRQINGPTDVPIGYEEFLAYVRGVKTQAVAEDPENHDLTPVVRIWGSEPFHYEVTAFCDTMERDKALWAASVLCGLVGAEGVMLVSDALCLTEASDSPNNPHTGEPWANGDMQKIWQAGNADGLVSECLMFHTVWTNGRHRAETSRYTIKDGALLWHRTSTDVLDTASTTSEQSVTGNIPETLHSVLTERPDAIVMLTQMFEQLGLEPNLALVHRMSAAVQTLGREGFMCMVGGDDKFIKEHLGSLPGAREVDLPQDDPLERLLEDS